MRRHLTGRSLASETVDEIFDVEIFALTRSVAPSLPWLLCANLAWAAPALRFGDGAFVVPNLYSSQPLMDATGLAVAAVCGR